LVIKDGRILVERYQYDRNPTHRFVSHSMAKSIVSLAIGFALQEKKIGSLDDRVAKYVPRLGGSAYGETSIRNLLRMSSGVRFNEVYDGKDDLAKFTALRNSQGSIEALRAFTHREVEQGTRFHYATSETVALSALIHAVTGGTLSAYLTERLWQPMGAEADATWIKTADGLEVGGGSFNAVLRDYGRLGILLANDGAVGAQQIVPWEYLLEATDLAPTPPGIRAAASHATFRIWLSVLDLPRREAEVCTAWRLRPIDVRRSGAKARHGHHGCGQKRQRRQGVTGRGARCGLARSGSHIRELVAQFALRDIPKHA
jgi:CubicO group peptidase (beta-lactamase class C family)